MMSPNQVVSSQQFPMPERQTVVISVLNWNSAAVTLDCVRSVLALPPLAEVRTELVVVDNGSQPADAEALAAGLAGLPVQLLRLPANLGFAGGHNVAMRAALERGVDFIWLLNSDACVTGDSLQRLLALMAAQPRCGAASPLIVRLGKPEVIDFAGAAHDWARLDSQRPLELPAAQALARQRPRDLWVVGTAILLRAAALREVGLLDERYFAYYEDDDICARLAAAGWHSAMAFDAQVEHACFEGVIFDRPPYYFYLMARNAFRFWGGHAPAGQRRWLRLRLLESWLFMANRLHLQGLAAKREACLLGIYDGLLGRAGRPELQRRTPWPLRLVRQFRERSHRQHLLGWQHGAQA